ncbi:YjgN family protein [Massilia agri]|uniref:YjgN family protein n=1 Tax=Massilia agri TaxID=1886785 RepID=A0ABT2AFB8_9BURK|nr:YjgN family protein [Massilia agri]MCS0594924.1 YjgN family protein [Massilia agri]
MHTLIDQPADAIVAPPDPGPRTLALSFTGDGREYFRIWVVNLLLSLATLGIYSAWAKVRRLQYFDRNTILAGATFDFHGNPRAVLVGRLLSVVLLGAYHYAFGFSTAFGLAVILGLLAAFPYLMRGALRFRLGNTSYRGLWLGFDGSITQAYLAWLPPALVFLLPGVLLALYPERPELAALPLPFYLAWPLMHAQLRRFQHAHLLLGDQHSSYAVKARSFYKPYLVAGSLGIAVVMTAGILVGVAGAMIAGPRQAGMVAGLLTAVITVYVMYLLAGPYMVVRISNLAWSNTTFPGVRIRSTLPARAFMKLQTKNVLLTLLTLGLYRPFAVVSVYRFRLAHVEIEVDGDIEAFATHVAKRGGAAGDGAADGFGIDLSW